MSARWVQMAYDSPAVEIVALYSTWLSLGERVS